MRIIAIIICSLVCMESFATVRLVPSQYKSVQLALDDSKNGDTILVSNGVYNENITWPQTNNLHLLAINNDAAVIDGKDSGRVINITWLGTKPFFAEIKGFVIQHGFINVPAHTGGDGAGVFASNAALKISNCIFTKNNITSSFAVQNAGRGAGLDINATPAGYTNSIDNCSFKNNSIHEVTNGSGTAIYFDNAPAEINYTTVNNNAMSVGDVGIGTIYAYQSNLKINAVKIENNAIVTTEGILTGTAAIKGGALFLYLSNTTITNLLAANNKLTPQNTGLLVLGNGIYFYGEGSGIKISNSTIAGNKRTDGVPANGNGIYYSSLHANNAAIFNSVFWNEGKGTEIYNQSKKINVSYTDVRTGYTGVANINTNPQFISATDFHLSNNSPCINAGNNAVAPSKDLDGNNRPSPEGSNADLGCYENDQQLIADAAAANNINHGMNAFPNPSNGKFKFSVTQSWVGCNMQLFDAKGKIYFNGAIRSLQTSYDFTNLPNGVYYIKLSNIENNSASIKIIIEK